MSAPERVGEPGWQDFVGVNEAYVLDLYRRYLEDPASVDEGARAFFARAGAPPAAVRETPVQPALAVPSLLHLMKAVELFGHIRAYGHLQARTDPLSEEVVRSPLLDMSRYGLTEEDLRSIPASIWPTARPEHKTAWDVMQGLLERYTGPLGYEFAHVHDPEEQDWLYRMVEQEGAAPLTREERRRLLARLVEVEEFEHFLQRVFPGQKRFSVEGTDALIPMLDAVIHAAARDRIRHVMIGMAHRGRLNVLAHVLGKPYAAILSEFHTAPNPEMVPSEGSMGINQGWTGDVKYHLGAERELREEDMVEVRLTLAHNPSHLEFVDPVVQGFTRAVQDRRDRPGAPVQDVDAALAILVHGDASFPGEGIAAETLNLSRLPGYRTGGTVHIIVNNRLGFTTEAEEGRSTRYASDLAKGFEIPVVHVCADDPEACLAAARLAYAYRRRFHKDFLIDLVGYRRWGHNEGDDPTFTQPVLYAKIGSHPTVREQYASRLLAEGVVTEEEVRREARGVQERLEQAHAEAQSMPGMEAPVGEDGGGVGWEPAPDLGVDRLRAMGEELLRLPDGFQVHPRLKRVLERRRQALESGEGVDWAWAETLAFAAILADGTPVRLSGQDSERGTFSQRHLVLRDYRTGAPHVPLHAWSGARASFAVYNSPLSEASVLGFEYGYSVQAPSALVLWEAQYGDFANGAQVIIDQFISSGEAKWRQHSGLVLLLPHGYEGQGPEHSSARMERYLQLSAENNWRVAYPSTAAQYFHLLRQHARSLHTHPRPLVVFTPKSLLRHPLAASSLAELAQGGFAPVLEDPRVAERKEAVEKILLCTGKVAIDLAETLERAGEPFPWLAVVRLEQLYPFPSDALRRVLEAYRGAREVVFVQEEPENMGAWQYVRARIGDVLPPHLDLAYVGRPEHASPAEGFMQVHAAAQRRILEQALRRPGAGARAKEEDKAHV